MKGATEEVRLTGRFFVFRRNACACVFANIWHIM